MGSFAAQYLQFDQHDMTVVEVDGVYTKPYTVSQLFMTSGQRYSVIVIAKSNSKKNYAIVTSMNEGMFDPGVTRPDLKNNVNIFDTYRDVADSPQATSWLVYDRGKPLPAPFTIPYLPFDDTVFIPNDNLALLGPVTDSYVPRRTSFVGHCTDL
jgi:iron transport multicopper oxidase